ncbi:MAG: DUF4190 domain-containing protein [Actinomycetales bacterium]
MSQQPPSNPPGESFNRPVPYLPPDYAGAGAQPRPPFSRQAIAGFVISCVSVFIFGFMGLVGAFMCLRSLRDVRTGRARGRGLAIAGAIIGVLSFALYVVSLFLRNS